MLTSAKIQPKNLKLILYWSIAVGGNIRSKPPKSPFNLSCTTIKKATTL